MRRKLVVGNWKMNGSIAANQALLGRLVEGLADKREADYVVCVPYPYLSQAQSILKGTNVAWGAQNISAARSGALTGAVSPGMLADWGCTHVIIGHSERRSQFHETDDTAAARFHAARQVGITPVFCMGESGEERDSDWTEYIVGRQLDSLIRRYGARVLEGAVLAYEPLWAVGSSKPATPQQAQEVHVFMRERIALLDKEIAQNVQILYGGSVTGANAQGLFDMPDIDGGLIGRASLDAEDFIAICAAANRAAHNLQAA